MTYLVEWGRDDAEPDRHGRRRVDTAADLDAALDAITASATRSDKRFAALILPDVDLDDLPPALHIGIGHPERSYAQWISRDGGGYAIEPDLSPWPDEITFDHGGQPCFMQPRETRLSPSAARAAAREYVATGQRPRGVEWIPFRPQPRP